MGNVQCIRERRDEEQIHRCSSAISDNYVKIVEAARIFALAGNDVRLRILLLLVRERELCPCDFAEILSVSAPAISQHLRKLKDGNLVVSRRDSQTLRYSLNPVHLPLLLSIPFFENVEN